MNTIKFIGMDVHKKTITIAIADLGRQNKPRVYGAIANDLDAVDKFCRKMVSTASRLYFVYEAGPCGYGLYRHLTAKGFDCMVAAPSLIPKKSGDRVKTDRRDAAKLAQLHRAGELTAVYVPDPQDEAMRELEEAINLVRSQSKPVELSPQNAYLRKLQHRAAEAANLVSRSRGRDPRARSFSTSGRPRARPSPCSMLGRSMLW